MEVPTVDIPELSKLNLPEKEQKILLAAIEIFAEKGFSAATTSEIAKNAGVAEGTIFRYFKTKKDILRGILIQAINLLSLEVVIKPFENILRNASTKDLRTVIKEVVKDRLLLVERIFPMARVVFTEAVFHEDIREVIYQNIITRAVAAADVFRQNMAERGLLRKEIDTESLVRCVLGNIAALILQRKLFGDKFVLKDLETEIDRIVDIVLYGIASTPGVKEE